MPYSHLDNVVISDSDAAMLDKPVVVRDGDDLIEFKLPEPEDKTSVKEGDGTDDNDVDDPEALHEDETGTDEGDGTDEGEDGEPDDESPELELPEFHKVDPKDLNEAAALMREAEQGQADLAAAALAAGLEESAMDTMRAEYAKDGKISEESFEKLSKVGYSRSFVESYMAGQEAVAERFVKNIMAHVGGQENFAKVTEHMAKHNPEAAQAFNAAVERNDVATIRTLLDAAVGQVRQSPASKAPKRNLAAGAKPATTAPKADKVEGFTSRQEMVKAMSDARYRKDANYRREVELKVLHSLF